MILDTNRSYLTFSLPETRYLCTAFKKLLLFGHLINRKAQPLKTYRTGPWGIDPISFY